ncbi:hypothetical protein PILCRDRAFT_686274 [Piloderma croceum F 1598]|uniref:Uncharacterized protein n=1 Tax=Piloderma croceum (strain F 1598) TaxID=765440 RepID=A0A0C3AMQ4_PILCF|nr:hypothetical protein PILCRDRAFT_686274 [Piloderma croceum F 1598]
MLTHVMRGPATKAIRFQPEEINNLSYNLFMTDANFRNSNMVSILSRELNNSIRKARHAVHVSFVGDLEIAMGGQLNALFMRENFTG